MSKCTTDIRLDITDNVRRNLLLNKDVFSPLSRETVGIIDANKAAILAREINTSYKEDIVQPSFSTHNAYAIFPSDNLVRKYYTEYHNKQENFYQDSLEEDRERGVDVEKAQAEGYLQTKDGKEASPSTISRLHEFLKRNNIDVRQLSNTIVGGLSANAIAKPIEKLIQIAEGKESVSLPEESAHIAVSIMQQTDKALYQKMLSAIGNYPTYEEVKAEYGTSPFYQLEDGRLNIPKLKDEAIGKVIADHIINKKELSETPEQLAKVQQWWQWIKDLFKRLLSKAAFNPFEEAAQKILNNKVEGTPSSNESFLQTNNDQQLLYNKITTKDSQILKEKSATEKDDRGNLKEQYKIGDHIVKNRVTDMAKRWYGRVFGNQKDKSEFQQAVDDLKTVKGLQGHADLENAFHSLVDDNGGLRDTPNDDSTYISQIDPSNKKIYSVLKDNLQQRLKSFPVGSKFLSEIKIYDDKKDRAGTMDLLVITPDGKVNIIDWKFINLNTTTYKDVPWYKVEAWRIQISEYKRILKDVYGVKDNQFGQTRAIPILTTYSIVNKDSKQLPILTDVKIGNVNVKFEKEDYLLPVGLENETTGNKDVDALLEKLNALYDKQADKPVEEGKKYLKAEQLNALYTAIRQLQIKQNIEPLLDQAKILNKNIDETLQRYTNSFEGKEPSQFSNRDISNYANELQDAQQSLNIYRDLDVDINELLGKDTLIDTEKLEKEVSRTSFEAKKKLKQLSEIDAQFTDNFIAKRRMIDTLLEPEKVVKGLVKEFRSLAQAGTAALQTLWRVRNEVKQTSDIETQEENKKLEHIYNAYKELATKKGWDRKNFFDIIKEKDSHELISEFSKKFYKDANKELDAKNRKWVDANIDTEAYRAWVADYIKEHQDYIATERYSSDDEKNNKRKEELLTKLKTDLDLTSPTSAGWFNYRIKKFPLSNVWESEEYKTLLLPENKAALDFYNYIKERNEFARSIGYLDNKKARTFLPYAQRGLIEKLMMGGKLQIGENFLRSISLQDGDIGFGKYDALDNKIVDEIPKYMTSELDNPSQELFQVMSLFNDMIIRYKYLDDIEGQVRALNRIEKIKGSLLTDNLSRVIRDENGKVRTSNTNEQNAKLLEEMTKAVIYGQRYINTEQFDQLFGNLENVGKGINKFLGVDWFPTNLEGRKISVTKAMDSINRVFQQKILGINVLSSMSNFLGGSFQAYINAGTWFTSNEFVKNEMNIAGMFTNNSEGKLRKAAWDYFIPLTENYAREEGKKMVISPLSSEAIQDFLMGMMRKGDQFVSHTIFQTLLDNTIIQDGELVNVRQYVHSQQSYRDRYNNPTTLKQSEKEAEDKIEQLKKDHGVLKLSKIENDKLVIPGIDRKSPTVYNLRNLMQQIGKDALGNLSEDDIRRINLTIIGKSFMMFKNWIPRLVDVRFGELRYSAATDAYEWGRTRTFFKIIGKDFMHSITNLRNSLQANQKGVDFLRQLYNEKVEKYERTSGSKLKMTEDEFMDLTRQNIKAQIRDVLFYASLMGMFFAAQALPPSKDDDPRLKNYYKFSMRALDKFSDEVGFFYNPLSFQQILNGSLFPSMGVFTDAARLMENVGIDLFGLTFENGDWRDKHGHVLKYVMRQFPLLKNLGDYAAVLSPDFSKYVGLPVTSQSRLK